MQQLLSMNFYKIIILIINYILVLLCFNTFATNTSMNQNIQSNMEGI